MQIIRAMTHLSSRWDPMLWVHVIRIIHSLACELLQLQLLMKERKMCPQRRNPFFWSYYCCGTLITSTATHTQALYMLWWALSRIGSKNLVAHSSITRVLCSCSHFKAIYISGDDGKSPPSFCFLCRFQILHTACYPVKYVDTVCDSDSLFCLAQYSTNTNKCFAQ